MIRILQYMPRVVTSLYLSIVHSAHLCTFMLEIITYVLKLKNMFLFSSHGNIIFHVTLTDGQKKLYT